MKLSQEKFDRILSMATEVAEREGCSLYDLESVGQGNQRILRVFIDKVDGGVSHDDCSNTSKGLSLLLDVDGLMEDVGAYNLEVSSPGLERHLRTSDHYQAVVKKEVNLHLTRSLGELVPGLPKSMSGQKRMKGKVVKVSEHSLTLVLISKGKEELEFELPLTEVKRGQLIHDFKTGRVGKR